MRGFLAGVVRKRLELKLGSKKVDGNRVYQIERADPANPPLASLNAGRPESMPRMKIGPALPDRENSTSRLRACVISTFVSFAAVSMPIRPASAGSPCSSSPLRSLAYRLQADRLGTSTGKVERLIDRSGSPRAGSNGTPWI